MQVLKSLSNLGDDMSREVFAEVGEADDLMKEFSTRGQLEDDVVVLFRLGEIDELDDVFVLQAPHDLNLLENICSL